MRNSIKEGHKKLSNAGLHKKNTISAFLILLLEANMKGCDRYTVKSEKKEKDFVVVVLLFYIHGKHLRSCRDGQLT